MDLLEMNKVSKSFFSNKVLTDVDFCLKSGEIHCLAGENGAGKSTIVKILTGVNTDYCGDIYIDGELVQISSPLVSRAKGIFAVQQHRDLVPTMNAVENIFHGNYLYKKDKKSIDMKTMRQKAQEYLQAFQVSFNLDVPIHELKVGEHGLIAICKALASNGKILIMDEASAPLDNFERQVLYKLLKQLRNEGKGIIYITHHLEEMFEIGDRITILRNGIVAGTFQSTDIDRTGLINGMTGNKKIYERQFNALKDETQRSGETPIIEYDQVTNSSLSGISFKIYQGETIGFAGIDGSAKEVIAEMAFGLVKPQSGSINFRGKPLRLNHPVNAIRQGIGFVPTDRHRLGLITCQSIAENLALPMINKSRQKIISKRWMNSLAKESIASLGIKATSTMQLVEYLSGGNQQKVLVGKWIHAKSDLLFLIEPTEGIDVGARADIYQLLKELANSGKTIVVFSSDIDELMTLSDRIYTVAQGRILNEYDAEQVDKRQILSDILTKQS